ncbi:tyrosine-protein kinase CSK [Capsaspora owczarzaki ATCC 30864]|uniref:receptor protein-tyrosine kinase n=1 Tax=Capsaspora owczarzaki (strain ATCC 30864) TaxID=595528 RepID=A0A0D2UTC4_CAPO3|nr:tyrosine-protein kinase CSK [Capsaspora owczarzaki ATCC 30864]KJE98231.1 TKL protein kinase [Capsaspora owczarzaki ATCC 30864]|eukprot:XP_004342482.1 tyrosine-protein kinase CSK [Capsaspora owczarzaki ATCC 30864]
MKTRLFLLAVALLAAVGSVRGADLDITFTAATGNYITLSWAAYGSFASPMEYRVTRSPGPATAVYTGTALIYTDISLTKNTAYTYTVSVYSDIGAGATLLGATAAPPSQTTANDVTLNPNSILLTNHGASTVGPSGTIAYPAVEYKLASAGTDSYAYWPGYTSSPALVLDPGTWYNVRITVSNQITGTANVYQVFTGRTGFVDPVIGTALAAGTITATQVPLSWTVTSSGQESTLSLAYTLFRNGSQVGTTAVYAGSLPNTFSYTDSGLSPYTLYTYTVRVTNAVGNYTESTLTVTTVAAAPTVAFLTTAPYSTQNSVTVGWTLAALNGPTPITFVLKRGSIILALPPESSSALATGQFFFTDDGLDPCTTYSYTLTATTSEGQTVTTSAKSFTTLADQPVISATVTSLNYTYNAFSFSWTSSVQSFCGAGSVGASGYQVMLNSSAISPTTATSYSLSTGVTSGATYDFSLVFTNAYGNVSEPVALTTFTTFANTPTVTTPTLTTSAANSLTFQWNGTARGGGPLVYKVDRTAPSSLSIKDYADSLTSATDNTGLLPFTDYTYSVQARNAVGNTSTIATATFKTAAAQATFSSTTVSSTPAVNSIQFSWTAATWNSLPGDYAWAISGSPTPSPSAGIVAATSVTVSNLRAYNQYNFTVIARSVSGTLYNSDPLTASNFLTLAAAPTIVSTQFTSTGQTFNSVSLEWNGVLTLINGPTVNSASQWTVERRLNNPQGAFVSVGAFPAANLSATDSDALLAPYTVYDYRLTVSNDLYSTSAVLSSVRTAAAPPTIDPSLIVPSFVSNGPTSYAVTFNLTGAYYRGTPASASVTFLLRYKLTSSGSFTSAPTFTTDTTTVTMQASTVYTLEWKITNVGALSSISTGSVSVLAIPPSFSAPTILTLSVTTDTATISWPEPTTKNGGDPIVYWVQFTATQPNPGNQTIQTFSNTLQTTSTTVTGLYPGIVYNWTVAAKSADSGFSKPFSTPSTLRQDPADPIWLIAPTLSASGRTTSSFALNWAAPVYAQDNPSNLKYRIVATQITASPNYPNPTLLFKTVAVNSAAVTVAAASNTGYEPYVQYSVTVHVKSSTDNWVPSNRFLTVTTASSQPSWGALTPSSIMAVPSSRQITLDWPDVPYPQDTNYLTYSVSRGGTTVASDLATSSYVDTGLTPFTNYAYIITAYNFYRLACDTTQSSNSTVTVSTRTITSLLPFRTYAVTIQATNGAGTSPPSDSRKGTFTTSPSAPILDPRWLVAGTTDTSVIITWKGPQPWERNSVLSSYRVECRVQEGDWIWTLVHTVIQGPWAADNAAYSSAVQQEYRAVFSGLLPNRNYGFMVTATGSSLTSNPIEVQARTLPATPTETPTETTSDSSSGGGSQASTSIAAIAAAVVAVAVVAIIVLVLVVLRRRRLQRADLQPKDSASSTIDQTTIEMTMSALAHSSESRIEDDGSTSAKPSQKLQPESQNAADPMYQEAEEVTISPIPDSTESHNEDGGSTSDQKLQPESQNAAEPMYQVDEVTTSPQNHSAGAHDKADIPSPAAIGQQQSYQAVPTAPPEEVVDDDASAYVAGSNSRRVREGLTIGKHLASGEFGDVSLGQVPFNVLPTRAQTLLGPTASPTVLVAVKSSKADADEKSRQDFEAEAKLMAPFVHPNVVRLLAALVESEPHLVLLEFVQYGDLRTLLQKSQVHSLWWTQNEQIHAIRQIALGMEYLGTLNFVHRDLAARNCLVGQGMVVKIADFGLSRELTDEQDYYRMQTRGKLPVKWMAPETMTFRKFSSMSDVWSFGVTAWECSSYGATPYSQMNGAEALAHLEAGGRLPRPEHCSTDLFSLMFSCWNSIPELRPSFTQLVKALKNFDDGTAIREIGALL